MWCPSKTDEETITQTSHLWLNSDICAASIREVRTTVQECMHCWQSQLVSALHDTRLHSSDWWNAGKWFNPAKAYFHSFTQKKKRSCTNYELIHLMKLYNIKFPISWWVVRPADRDRQGERKLICALLHLQFRRGQKQQPIFVHPPLSNICSWPQTIGRRGVISSPPAQRKEHTRLHTVPANSYKLRHIVSTNQRKSTRCT